MKPTTAILKGFIGRHGSNYSDDLDRITLYNGIEVKWFIGDINFRRAQELGCCNEDGKAFAGSGSIRVTNRNGAYWEAWGSALGKAYQLSAWFNTETMELSDITVNANKDSPYYNKNNYDLLTK